MRKLIFAICFLSVPLLTYMGCDETGTGTKNVAEKQNTAQEQPVSENDKGTITVKFPGYNIHELFRAIAEGNPNEVWKILQEGADYDAKDENGQTPLMDATYRNKRNILKLLIEKGADLNARNDRKETALFISARYDVPFEITDILLKAGADPNIQDINGDTPLIVAVRRTSLEKVELLLHNGADRNMKNFSNENAMSILDRLFKRGLDENDYRGRRIKEILTGN